MSKKQVIVPTDPHEAIRFITRQTQQATAILALHGRDLWRRFVDSLLAFMRGDAAEYERIATELAPAEQHLGAVVRCLFEQADRSYYDLLGPIHMEFGANKGAGQFFTPFEVSRMMARLQIGAGEGLASFDPANPCRINDPAVGSGGMLLAAAEVIADLGLEDRLHDGTILFYAQDVDPLCAAMTELNFRLHKLAGYVACANTLTDPDPWADPTRTRYIEPAAITIQRYRQAARAGLIRDELGLLAAPATAEAAISAAEVRPAARVVDVSPAEGLWKVELPRRASATSVRRRGDHSLTMPLPLPDEEQAA